MWAFLILTSPLNVFKSFASHVTYEQCRERLLPQGCLQLQKASWLFFAFLPIWKEIPGFFALWLLFAGVGVAEANGSQEYILKFEEHQDATAWVGHKDLQLTFPSQSPWPFIFGHDHFCFDFCFFGGTTSQLDRWAFSSDVGAHPCWPRLLRDFCGHLAFKCAVGSSDPGSVNSQRLQIYPGECTQGNLTSDPNYPDNDLSFPEFSRFLLMCPLYSMLVRLSCADWGRVFRNPFSP